MRKRILSIVAMMCMVLTLIPSAAFAEDEGGEAKTYEVTYEYDGDVIDTVTKTHDVDLILSNEAVERDGFEQAGWTDGKTTYDMGGKYSDNKDVTLYPAWKEAADPVITGLENDKIYCGTVKFQVTDNVGVASVEFGDMILTADSEGYYTIEAGAGEGMVVAKDAAGNAAYCMIEVNDGHVYNWHDDGKYYWEQCDNCGDKLDKKAIPAVSINISGADKVCRANKYVFTFEVPDGCKNPGGYIELNGKSAEKEPICTVNGNVATVTVPAGSYGNAGSFDAVAFVTLDDGYLITARKEGIQVEHTGLQHVDAKAATKESDGNIEYWYCRDCGKYYSDAAAKHEITQADTVVSLSSDSSKSDRSSATGDDFNLAALIALLIAAGGTFAGVSILGRRRQTR